MRGAATASMDVAIAMRRGDFVLDVAFEAREPVTALFGRSGAGKSTVLGAIAGLSRPDRGHIRLGDVVLFDSDQRIDIPRHRRRIGLVFQDAQLFPHLDVKANLAFGRRHGRAGANGPDFDTVVGILGLGPLLARRPRFLSGGERQRVAIGRALLSAPRLLLLDEPLAALDLARRQEILPLIERMRDEFRIPILYVSHAVEEVARLAGEVVVLEGGQVSRTGRPEDVLLPQAPSSEARFDGISVLNVRVNRHDEAYGLTLLDHPAGEITVPGRARTAGSPARLIIRGTDVSLSLARPVDVSVRTILGGRVLGITVDDGALARVDLGLPGGDRLAAFVTRKAVDDLGLSVGREVYAMIKAAAIDGDRGGN